MGYKSSTRGTRPVSLLGIHTAEGARTARSLAAYFYRDDIMASSHDIVDAAETLHIVDYSRAAWTMRSANPISDNLEICAFARWSRAQWLSTDTVDGCANPKAMLDRTGDWIARRCAARNIPVRRLAIVQLQQGYWGVIAHDDWSKAMQDGTHWDPGTGFPWDYVLARAAGIEEDDMDGNTIITFGRLGTSLKFSDWVGETNATAYAAFKEAEKATAEARAVRQELAEVKAKLDQVAAGNVDYVALATAVADETAKRMSA